MRRIYSVWGSLRVINNIVCADSECSDSDCGVSEREWERGEYLANTLKYRHHTVYLDAEAADPCQDVG